MKAQFILIASALLLFSCSEKKVEQTETKNDTTNFKHHATSHQPAYPSDSAANPFHGKVITAVAYKNEDLSWGYVISIDGKKTINQPHVPGVTGVKGFNTKAQALKTADFVIYKIQHNMLPPSVTPQELDSLGVLKEVKN